MGKTLLMLVSLMALTACQLAGGGPLAARGNVPPAADRSARGVDGLLVGHRLMAAGEPELALKAYFRAAAEDGVNADVLSAIGSANLALGRLGQAEKILLRALEQDATFVPAINNLGVVLMEQGRAPEARIYFQRAYALDSGNSDAIRDNLKRAIAMTENSIYADAQAPAAPQIVYGQTGSYELVRRGDDEIVTLSGL